MTFPRTARHLREVLEARGVRPRKRHGQNFLTDAQAVDAIVRDAGVTAADHVVEVGTGAGLLTHVLAETGASVHSFEVDGAMLAVARSLRTWPERVVFVEGDVLAGKRDLAPAFLAALAERPAPPGRRLLVSNLPYGAGTPIVLAVLGLEDPPDDLVVMLQREVVVKLLARPGSPAYGAPTVVVALQAEGRVLRRFGPEVFWPRPKVDSTVVQLTPRTDTLLGSDEHRPFGAFVIGLFARRRKVIASGMRSASEGLGAEAARAVLAAEGVDPAARVQDLAPERILGIWRATRALGAKG